MGLRWRDVSSGNETLETLCHHGNGRRDRSPECAGLKRARVGTPNSVLQNLCITPVSLLYKSAVKGCEVAEVGTRNVLQ